MPERLRLLSVVCTTLMMFVLFVVPQSSLSNIASASTLLGHSPEQQPLVVVLGLANSLNDDVKRAIDTELDHDDLSVIELNDQPLASVDWPEKGLVVAAGVSGCEQTTAVVMHLDVRCVLLTEESFRDIRTTVPSTTSRSLSALVIDQPITRQARVAQRVYPALSRFAVLSESQTETAEQRNVTFSLNIDKYRSNQPLAPQLSEALASNDALIAVPETSVFNRTTLRTVLLTAYGYGKPVIGLSRAYVKAGALITTYSTPEQVFREIAENLNEITTTPQSAVSYPRYFSIADNINVARSLRLTKLLTFDAFATFTDRELQP